MCAAALYWVVLWGFRFTPATGKPDREGFHGKNNIHRPAVCCALMSFPIGPRSNNAALMHSADRENRCPATAARSQERSQSQGPRPLPSVSFRHERRSHPPPRWSAPPAARGRCWSGGPDVKTLHHCTGMCAAVTRPTAHSEHRFPAPSAKLCQI